MAAIAGVLRFDQAPEARADAVRLMAAMAHRAPDGIAVHGEDGIGLAHGGLHATPECVHARQPVAVGERWLVLVDGRIDNRGALLRTFGIAPADAPRIGDADLFARAWLHWGMDFWQHVVGDFALAAWDRRQRSLTLVRDRIGVRPLFFAQAPGLFAFASEPEALLGLPGVSRACREDSLAALLVPGFDSAEPGATVYRDVRRLLPAGCVQVSASGQASVACYWRMQPGTRVRRGDAREYLEAFREVFAEAVRCRLRTPHRPALMLSGGIDSAAILAAAVSLRGDASGPGLLPISVVGDDPAGDAETANILRLHELAGGMRLPLASLPDGAGFAQLRARAWDRAHPVENSLLLPGLIYANAREAGSNVVLDGIDGDLVMRSSDHHAGALALAGHPLRGWREARLASRNNTYLRGESPLRILANGLAGGLEPLWMSAWRYRLQQRRRGEAELGGSIDPAFARRLRLRERMLGQAIAERRRRARESHAEDLAHVWWNPGLSRGMEGYDRTAAAAGVEARHPWCDQRVLEFFLALPAEWKARDGWTKWIARAAYEAELGGDVVWHTGKSHLGYRVALQVLDASSGDVHGLLHEARERLRGVVDEGVLARLLAAWPPGPAALSDEDRGIALELATLAGWMRRHDLRLD